MSLGKALMHFVVLVLAGLLWTLAAWPQSPEPIAPSADLIAINWDKAVNAAERLGICIVGLGIMAYLLYRQNAIETVTKRYDESAAAHLAAFQHAMTEAQKLAEDYKDTAVLCAQVNTSVAAKLDQLMVAARERSA